MGNLARTRRNGQDQRYVIGGIRKLGIASSVKPEFLEQAAEYFGEEAVLD